MCRRAVATDSSPSLASLGSTCSDVTCCSRPCVDCGHATPWRALATERSPNVRWMGERFTAHLIHCWVAPIVGKQAPTRQRKHDTSAKQNADSIHTPASLTLGMQQLAGTLSTLSTNGIPCKQDTTPHPPPPPRPPATHSPAACSRRPAP
jgi:hypothetical protein